MGLYDNDGDDHDDETYQVHTALYQHEMSIILVMRVIEVMRNYLREGGYVMLGVCLSVCLSVSKFT